MCEFQNDATFRPVVSSGAPSGVGRYLKIKNVKLSLGHTRTSTLRSRRRYRSSRPPFDGEIVCLDEDGCPQFQDLLFHRGEPCFFAFDVVALEGQDLRTHALIEQKADLRRLLSRAPDTARIRYADHVERSGMALFDLVCERDWRVMPNRPTPLVIRDVLVHVRAHKARFDASV